MTKIDRFTKEELQQLTEESVSFRELSDKLGYVTTGSNNQTIKKRLTEYGISTDHFNSSGRGKTIRTIENIFCESSTASQATLRRWYLKQNIPYKCVLCGQDPIWQGKELGLTLDHINGHNHDNRLENLRWVCPNCDRQLETFGYKQGKN